MKSKSQSLKAASSRMMTPLTEKEKLVLEFIEQRLSESGISPSYQEIRNHFGFASFNSVQNYLKQLSTKGYIEIPSHQKRAIHILHPSSSVQQLVHLKQVETKKETPREHLLLPREEVLSLPLLGKVAAGKPLEAFDYDEHIDVPPALVRNAEKTFALRVSGNSMIEDGIHDGDIILVQKQETASNGEIVVATIENESTVKRYFLKSKIELSKIKKSNERANTIPMDNPTEKWVELRPANSNMESMWYPPNQIDIQGVVVGLIRKF